MPVRSFGWVLDGLPSFQLAILGEGAAFRSLDWDVSFLLQSLWKVWQMVYVGRLVEVNL